MTNENAKGCGLSRFFDKLGERVKKVWEWVKKHIVVLLWCAVGLISAFYYFSDFDQLKSMYYASHLNWVIHDLDAGLFQVGFIGIFTLYFGGAFVCLGSINDSKFERKVFLEEVLCLRKVAYICLFGFFVFAFFSGKDAHAIVKIIAIYLCLLFICLLYDSFKRFIDYIKGERHVFEIEFLKNNKLNKSFSNDKNKLRSDNLFLAFPSLWDRESDRYDHENELTSVFIEHVDSAIKTGHYDLASGLMEKYEKHIDKRTLQIVLEKMLPNVLLWCGLISDGGAKPIYNEFAGYFETICKLTITDEHDVNYQSLLFDKLEKYMDNLNNQKTKFYNGLIRNFFSIWCPMLFRLDAYWENQQFQGSRPTFLAITSENMKLESSPSRFIFREFLKWAKEERPEGKNLELLYNVESCVFPNARHHLLHAFFSIYFSLQADAQETISQAIAKLSKFPCIEVIFSGWSLVSSESNYQSHLKNINFDDQSKKQKAEAIDIIYSYLSDCAGMSDNKMQTPEVVLFKNLDTYKKLLESDGIKKLYVDDTLKNANREVIFELINGLEKKKDETKKAANQQLNQPNP